MLIQLILVNTVKVHGISHKIITELLVFREKSGNISELFAVVDLSLEQL